MLQAQLLLMVDVYKKTEHKNLEPFARGFLSVSSTWSLAGLLFTV